MEIELSGLYLVDDLERLLRELEPAIQLPSATVVRLDLTRLAFIGPSCLAVLLATALRSGSALRAPTALAGDVTKVCPDGEREQDRGGQGPRPPLRAS